MSLSHYYFFIFFRWCKNPIAEDNRSLAAGNPTFVQKLISYEPTAGEYYGRSVSVSDDRLTIGALYSSTAVSSCSSVVRNIQSMMTFEHFILLCSKRLEVYIISISKGEMTGFLVNRYCQLLDKGNLA